MHRLSTDVVVPWTWPLYFLQGSFTFVISETAAYGMVGWWIGNQLLVKKILMVGWFPPPFSLKMSILSWAARHLKMSSVKALLQNALIPISFHSEIPGKGEGVSSYLSSIVMQDDISFPIWKIHKCLADGDDPDTKQMPFATLHQQTHMTLPGYLLCKWKRARPEQLHFA